MRYVVSARYWDEALRARFGNANSFHEMTSCRVIEAIIKFGRAHIETLPNETRSIQFQNEYD